MLHQTSIRTKGTYSRSVALIFGVAFAALATTACSGDGGPSVTGPTSSTLAPRPAPAPTPTTPAPTPPPGGTTPPPPGERLPTPGGSATIAISLASTCAGRVDFAQVYVQQELPPQQPSTGTVTIKPGEIYRYTGTANYLYATWGSGRKGTPPFGTATNYIWNEVGITLTTSGYSRTFSCP